MYRRNATSNSRTKVGALSALAVAIGTLMITTTPAKADPHFGFFFSAPFPFPVPVVVQHEVVYDEPHVVYERPYYQTYYPAPIYYGRPHWRHAGCHHDGGYGWGHRRADWNDDHDGRYYDRDAGYRGRY